MIDKITDGCVCFKTFINIFIRKYICKNIYDKKLDLWGRNPTVLN